MRHDFNEKNVDYQGIHVIEKKSEINGNDRAEQPEIALPGLFSVTVLLALRWASVLSLALVIGYYLDKYFTTYPYLTFIFMFFGIVAAFRGSI